MPERHWRQNRVCQDPLICSSLETQVNELQQQLAEAKEETTKMVGMLEAGLDQLQVLRCLWSCSMITISSPAQTLRREPHAALFATCIRWCLVNT